MFDIFRRKTESLGVALFRGVTPHSLDVDALARQGLKVEPREGDEGAHWKAVVEHSEWGRAELTCLRDPPRPPVELLEFDPRVSEEDVALIAECGVAISARSTGRVGFVLRDRKNLLRILDALLGVDGIAAVDTMAGPAYWTREALADELAHDADLDIESIYSIHAVGDSANEEEVSWFHTHGLGELGRFDFDILEPGESFMNHCGPFARALAFAILEGEVTEGETNVAIGHPLPSLYLMSIADFQRSAAPELLAIRDDPEGHHADRRVVLCESPRSKWLGRLLGQREARPSRLFQRDLPENVVFHFTNAATELMADRARRTLPVLGEILEEFQDLELPTLLKLGYPTDGAEGGEREHLWFELHDLREDSAEATLINSPWAVSGLQEGDRGTHPLELLSDWTVMTPVGPINPHAFYARRTMRRHRPEIEEMLRQHREQRGLGIAE